MALYINNNVAAFNSYRNLSSTQDQLGKSLEKLSSGFRINRAADDAAGLAISEGLRSQVGGYKQAVRNAQDGISLVQTAEGALNEVHSMLQRMRDLAVQGANDTNSAESRANINQEIDNLTKELTRIGKSTEFNGTKLLDGSAAQINFQVGAEGDADSKISVSLVNANLSGTGGVAAATAVGTYTWTDTALDTDGEVATAGSFAAADDPNLAQALALVKDAATATGTANIGKAHAAYQELVKVIDTDIQSISTARSDLGAVQNRFEHTINNLNVSVENLSASESRIRDTDMAKEMVQFQRNQVLSQAGTAMLAQANQLPQGVLQLLR